jgi:hypothetical protein
VTGLAGTVTESGRTSRTVPTLQRGDGDIRDAVGIEEPATLFAAHTVYVAFNAGKGS